jgi:hypothetical protein
MSVWNEWRAVVHEYRELDAERVLVLSHVSARGKTSGLEIGQMQTRLASAMHVRDDQCRKIDAERVFPYRFGWQRLVGGRAPAKLAGWAMALSPPRTGATRRGRP